MREGVDVEERKREAQSSNARLIGCAIAVAVKEKREVYQQDHPERNRRGGEGRRSPPVKAKEIAPWYRSKYLPVHVCEKGENKRNERKKDSRVIEELWFAAMP